MKLFFFLALLSLCACASESGNAGTGGNAGAGGNAGTGGFAGTGGDAGTGGNAGAGGGAGSDAGPTERVVFVTSASRTGNLGGIEGADALCASEAAAAGLDGEFKAWLSTRESAVADRIVQSSVPYVRTDGTRIADDWDDLIDPTGGYLQAFLNLDANGIARGGDVWTGTLPSGLAGDGDDCDGFTTGLGSSALCGSTQSINFPWTARTTPVCETPLRLFCFEQ